MAAVQVTRLPAVNLSGFPSFFLDGIKILFCKVRRIRSLTRVSFFVQVFSHVSLFNHSIHVLQLCDAELIEHAWEVENDWCPKRKRFRLPCILRKNALPLLIFF